MEQPRPEGRPPRVLTDDEIAQVEALAAVLNLDQIADFLDVARSTFQEILKRDERVSGRYKKGKAKSILNVGNGLLEKAINGDTASAIFYLKTQAGWKETQVQEHTLTAPRTLKDFYEN